MQPEREVEALHEAFFFNIYIPAKSLHVACIKLKTDKKCLDVTHFLKKHFDRIKYFLSLQSPKPLTKTCFQSAQSVLSQTHKHAS